MPHWNILVILEKLTRIRVDLIFLENSTIRLTKIFTETSSVARQACKRRKVPESLTSDAALITQYP